MKKALKISFYLVLVGLLTGVGINLYVFSRSERRIYYDVKKIPPAQAALVLGASVFASKKPSGILLERLDRAIELYRHKKVQKLLLSGDNSKRYYDEVNVMKDYVLRRKVPGRDIFLDHNGLRTLASIYRAKQVFQARKLLLVTQDFHLPRALFLADHIKLESFGYVANSGRVPISFKMLAREFSARILAFFDAYILDSQPRFKGKVTPLHLNGKITWDKQ